MSVISNTIIKAWAPLQYELVIVLNFYWPAVSQICNFTLSPLRLKALKRKSTPMVARNTSLKSLSAYLITIEDLPTQEFPTKTTLNRCKYYPLLISLIILDCLFLYIIIQLLLTIYEFDPFRSFKQKSKLSSHLPEYSQKFIIIFILITTQINLQLAQVQIEIQVYNLIPYHSMIKQAILFVLVIFGVFCQDDITHPHGQDAITRNLRSFEFPDKSQHGKTCGKN